MKRFIAAIVLLVGAVPFAWSCWCAIDPGAFAQDCPIIVTGTIDSVAAAAPGGYRSDDIATLRIDTVHRNELKDVALKAGDLFSVKMISRNNQARSSTDLNYAVKTRAVWLIVLTSKGEFRIDLHPVQKQPIDAPPPLGRIERSIEKRAGDPPLKVANPLGSKTKAEWIAWKKSQEVQHARSIAARYAQQKAIRDLAKVFADSDGLNDQVWRRFKESDTDIRRGIFQLAMHEQPMTGSRFAEAARGALLHEKDDNIRTHAVNQLAYCRDPGAKGMEVLAEALRDRSASIRLFACQSVKMRRYEKLADQVKQLQNDPDRQVREMATDTLEFWRKDRKGTAND